MAGEVFFLGVAVGGFDEGGCYASVADGTGNVCVEDVHDPSSYNICEIGRMTIDLDLKAAEVLVVFHPSVHYITKLLKRNIRLQPGRVKSKGVPSKEG